MLIYIKAVTVTPPIIRTRPLTSRAKSLQMIKVETKGADLDIFFKGLLI